MVQGALKLILEPIFEADFQPGSFGYRPKRNPQEAVQRVSDAIIQGKTYVIDLDLRAYFDTVRHHIALRKIATRVNDDDVMRLLRMILKATGKRGVPQGGVISPFDQEAQAKRVRQELAKLQVEVNEEKTRVVDLTLCVHASVIAAQTSSPVITARELVEALHG